MAIAMAVAITIVMEIAMAIPMTIESMTMMMKGITIMTTILRVNKSSRIWI